MNEHRLTRDQLRWLLLSMALMLGLQVPHLPVWISLLGVAAGSWRYAASVKRAALPKAIWLFAIAAAATLGILASHHGLFGRDASVSLLATMMALKLLESHTRRDATLLVFLSYFFGVTSFLFSQSLQVGAYLVLPVVALTATLVSVNHPNGTLPIKPTLRIAGLMLAQSAPIMLALFLLFPRIPGPLWGVPEDAYSGMTGLSDSMSPGSISQLSRSDSVAFRVEFKGPVPELSQLYWRGPVFWQYDGMTWTAGENARNLPAQEAQGISEEVRYTVTLEPHNRKWLFMLDLPETTPPESTLSHDYQLLAQQPVRLRMRYDGVSALVYRMGTHLAPETRRLALQLPHRNNPQALALGKQLADREKTAERIVQSTLRLFRDQPFRYTMTPPRLGENAVDDFLFTTRSGFCEHYAGSFVFLMRAAGVPARVVTGYQGGEINPVGKYLLVRQADAHAWAEVWLEDRGWVRVDPTAAVAPQRVESGVASALPAGEPVPALMQANMRWLRQLYLRWDAINNGWNQWVLGYDEKRQMQFLTRLAGSDVSWQDMVIGLMIAVGVIVLAIYAALIRDTRRVDPLQAAYQRWLRKLGRAGVASDPYEGPQSFGLRAATALPVRSQEIIRIASSYNRLRYGITPSAHQIETFVNEVRKFRL